MRRMYVCVRVCLRVCCTPADNMASTLTVSMHMMHVCVCVCVWMGCACACVLLSAHIHSLARRIGENKKRINYSLTSSTHTKILTEKLEKQTLHACQLTSVVSMTVSQPTSGKAS